MTKCKSIVSVIALFRKRWCDEQRQLNCVNSCNLCDKWNGHISTPPSMQYLCAPTNERTSQQMMLPINIHLTLRSLCHFATATSGNLLISGNVNNAERTQEQVCQIESLKHKPTNECHENGRNTVQFVVPLILLTHFSHPVWPPRPFHSCSSPSSDTYWTVRPVAGNTCRPPNLWRWHTLDSPLCSAIGHHWCRSVSFSVVPAQGKRPSWPYTRRQWS